MVTTQVATFSVQVTGVGRKDYSEQVEFSVEPIVRSHQSAYNYNNMFTLNPGEARRITINLPPNLVVLLYDFFASAPANALISFAVETNNEVGGLGRILGKVGYQKVVQHHERGTPSFPPAIWIYLTNNSALTLDISVNLKGIYMTREEYFQQVFT